MTEATKPERPKTARVGDPELQTLAKLDQLFAAAEPDVRQRFLYWLSDKYGDRFEPAPAAPKE